MPSKIIPSSQYKTTHWGAGSTTELFIYPEGSSYTERNFKFRLSIATIEESGSKFTSLAGIHRILMMLKGSITLHHEGQHSKTLQPLEKDEFEGGWSTNSIGIGTDFNLMTQGVRGTLDAIQKPTPLAFNSDLTLVYSYTGKTIINDITIPEGDLLVMEGEVHGLLQPDQIALIISINF